LTFGNFEASQEASGRKTIDPVAHHKTIWALESCVNIWLKQILRLCFGPARTLVSKHFADAVTH